MAIEGQPAQLDYGRLVVQVRRGGQHQTSPSDLPDLPRLHDLVANPLALTRIQLATTTMRPMLALGAFVWLAARGWYVLALGAEIAVFVTAVVVLHDVFHRNLGLRRHRYHALLTLYGALLLNSGHALARTHLEHHRVYPGHDDPEAYVDTWPVWRVVVEGPVYRLRVWAWAWRHRGGWGLPILAEWTVWLGAWVLAIALRHRVPELSLYVIVAELGAWTFPLISVSGVHDRREAGYLRQSRSLHIAAVGAVLLGMQHHLEHHLYPRVPAARLAEVAAALDPWLAERDAAVTRWPRRAPPAPNRRTLVGARTTSTRADSLLALASEPVSTTQVDDPPAQRQPSSAG